MSELIFKPFNELKISTITLVASLTRSVHIHLAFITLPITRIAIEQPQRLTKKCKLPHCSVPGAILSLRYRQEVRGLIRNTKRPFKNAVTIDISTKNKNVNVKLSSQSVHVCGASSREDGIEAATHVINHLIQVQQTLDAIQANKELAQEMVNWLKDNCKGEATEVPQVETRGRLRVHRQVTDYYLIEPAEPIPEHFNLEIYNFLLPMKNDFLYHRDFCLKLDFLLNPWQLILPDENQPDKPLESEYAVESMRNYNYHLGFNINKTNLSQAIDQVNGFICSFDQAFGNHGVNIKIPYTPINDLKGRRPKRKVPHHTFIVYNTGAVTQSGPGDGDMMEKVYYLFMETIKGIMPAIKCQPELI